MKKNKKTEGVVEIIISAKKLAGFFLYTHGYFNEINQIIINLEK